jgi:hypothetical protein
MNKTQTAGWTRRKGTFRAGEYAQSTVEVTEHVSANGRFVIGPTGKMRRVRQAGGGHAYRFRWTGFLITDNSPLCLNTSWNGRRFAVVGCKTVAEGKRIAAQHND